MPGNLITRILSLPFTLLSLILTRILRFRGVPYLRLAWPGSSSSSSSSYLDDDPDRGVIVDPVAASRAFVRGLAIHTRSDAGAGHYQRSGDLYGASSSSTASPAAASGSGSSSGSDRGKDGIWFTEGGYNAALRRAKEDNLVLCVVLTCREHDDHATFLRWVDLGSKQPARVQDLGSNGRSRSSADGCATFAETLSAQMVSGPLCRSTGTPSCSGAAM